MLNNKAHDHTTRSHPNVGLPGVRRSVSFQFEQRTIGPIHGSIDGNLPAHLPCSRTSLSNRRPGIPHPKFSFSSLDAVPHRGSASWFVFHAHELPPIFLNRAQKLCGTPCSDSLPI